MVIIMASAEALSRFSAAGKKLAEASGMLGVARKWARVARWMKRIAANGERTIIAEVTDEAAYLAA
jgi:hypothetical protein